MKVEPNLGKLVIWQDPVSKFLKSAGDVAQCEGSEFIPDTVGKEETYHVYHVCHWLVNRVIFQCCISTKVIDLGRILNFSFKEFSVLFTEK